MTKHSLYGKKNYYKYLLSDPVRKLKHHVSCSIRDTLTAQGNRKGGSTFANLPYTPNQLKEHLESLFEPWMSWDNYGSKWHIDHIIPHNAFKYTSLKDDMFKECWALSNLRPLEKHANLSRKKKI